MSPEDVAQLRRERDLYRSLLELGAHSEPDRFVASALRILVEIASARQGYLEVRDDGAVPTSWWAAEGCDSSDVESIRATVSKGIIAQALATGETIVTARATEDPRFRDFASVKSEHIESVLCVPIGDVPFGAIYLQGHASNSAFSPFDSRTRDNVELAASAIAPLADRFVARARQGNAVPVARPYGFAHIVGTSRAIEELTRKLALVAELDVHVLLTGPSGSGKTMLAQSIHTASPRRDGPFVELNCAAIPEALFESELFGAARGAHSAVAGTGTRGKVEAAEKGTLFLDEIGELTLAAQAKLLQILQDKTYYPLGSSDLRRADVRMVAATNADLALAVRERRFREDLYYRLRVIEARVPPLSEREGDVIALARHFCRRACARHAVGEKHLSPSALSAVATAEWPGNVRELAHCIEAAVLNAHFRAASEVAAHDVFPEMSRSDQEEAVSLQAATRRFQRHYLLSVLEAAEWNVSEAARRLDIARSHLYNLIRSYGLTREP